MRDVVMTNLEGNIEKERRGTYGWTELRIDTSIAGVIERDEDRALWRGIELRWIMKIKSSDGFIPEGPFSQR